MNDILELINFQDAIDQIARESTTPAKSLADIARMREWQFELRCYSALHVRYWAAIHERNLLIANHIYNVLDECAPRWRALDDRTDS